MLNANSTTLEADTIYKMLLAFTDSGNPVLENKPRSQYGSKNS